MPLLTWRRQKEKTGGRVFGEGQESRRPPDREIWVAARAQACQTSPNQFIRYARTRPPGSLVRPFTRARPKTDCIFMHVCTRARVLRPPSIRRLPSQEVTRTFPTRLISHRVNGSAVTRLPCGGALTILFLLGGGGKDALGLTSHGGRVPFQKYVFFEITK